MDGNNYCRNALTRAYLTLLTLLVAFASVGVAADDWTQFRGPEGTGVGNAAGLPATWGTQEHVVWTTKLPGPGTSSPVILGDRVYLTCYSGYAESIDEPGDMNRLIRHVVCVDRTTGAVLWTKDFEPKLPESEYRGGNNTRHGYASSTPATDGQRLYVFFGKSGVYGLDLEGNVIWNTDVGSNAHDWGSASSPVIYKNLVIVNAGVESGSLVALDRESGKIVWNTPGTKDSWGSPALVAVGEATEAVLNLPNEIAGFDPDTGEKVWHCEGISDSYVCPTPIVHAGTVFVVGGRKNETIAVRAGGRGDVTATQVLWKAKVGSGVTSPVYLDGYLYWFHDARGFAYCVNAQTGEVVFEEKLDPAPGLVYASVTAADGKLYAPSRERGTYVVAARPEFQQLAVNQFQDDPSRTNASLAVSANRLIMRTDTTLYCIGN